MTLKLDLGHQRICTPPCSWMSAGTPFLQSESFLSMQPQERYVLLRPSEPRQGLCELLRFWTVGLGICWSFSPKTSCVGQFPLPMPALLTWSAGFLLLSWLALHGMETVCEPTLSSNPSSADTCCVTLEQLFNVLEPLLQSVK